MRHTIVFVPYLLACGVAMGQQSGIDTTVRLLDAGLRPVPGNRFLRGEKVLVEVQLVNAAAAAQQAELDLARVRALREGRDVSALMAVPPVRALALGESGRPWVEQVSFVWGEREGGTRVTGVPQVQPVWKPDFLKRGLPQPVLETIATEIWEIDTTAVPLGAHRLAVRLPFATEPGAQAAAGYGLDLTLIEENQAPPYERARVRLHRAWAALNEGDAVQAIAAAQEAIQLGPEDPHDVAVLYRTIGEAHEQLGDVSAAIKAYTQARHVAEQERGTSRLPALLRHRLEELGVETHEATDDHHDH